MRLSRFLALSVWLVAVRSQQELQLERGQDDGRLRQYYLQNQEGSYKFGYKMHDKKVEGEVDPSSEMRGRYAYVDDKGDMRGVEYSAGVDGYRPRELKQEEMADMDLHKIAITQPTSDDSYYSDENVKTMIQRDKNRDRIVVVETLNDEESEEPGKDNDKENQNTVDLKKDKNTPEKVSASESNVATDKDEFVQGRYTFTGEDGLPATIEYEASPELGFVVKSFTKELPTTDQVADERGATGDSFTPDFLKDGSHKDSDMLHKVNNTEEGTEEMYPSGLVKGLYTYLEEDGVPATIEYEAGPHLGFKVKKFSKGKTQLQQVEEETGTTKTTLSSSHSLVSRMVEKISKTIRDGNEHEQIDSLLDPLKVKHTPVLPKPNHLEESRIYLNDDSSEHFRRSEDLKSENDEGTYSLEQVKNGENKEKEVKVPANASYRFGFSIDDQSRHEESDADGNVHGRYSYLDDEGLLTTVEYEAGAKKGFVIKRMTHEHTDSRTKESNSKSKLNYKKSPSPVAAKEYTVGRNIPIQYNSEQESLDDATISSSSKFYNVALPDNFNNYKHSEYYNNPPNNDQSYSYYPQSYSKLNTPNENSQTKRYLPYSNYDQLDDISTPDQVFSTKSAELPSAEEDQGFKVYGPPSVGLPPSYVPLYTEEIRRTVAERAKYQNRRKHHMHQTHHMHKKPTRKPAKPMTHLKPTTSSPPVTAETSQDNFSGVNPDGSYAFAYRTKDHSRAQSVDSNGNVHYSYRFNTKRDGNTIVVFSSKVANDSENEEQER